MGVLAALSKDKSQIFVLVSNYGSHSGYVVHLLNIPFRDMYEVNILAIDSQHNLEQIYSGTSTSKDLSIFQEIEEYAIHLIILSES